MNFREYAILHDEMTSLGAPECPDFANARTAWDLAQAYATTAQEPTGRVTDLDPEELVAYLDQLTLHRLPEMPGAAASHVQDRLTQEVRAALIVHVPVILDALRGPFTAAAKQVTKAAETGIRAGMSAADVIDLDTPAAITAWRALPEHVGTLNDIARLRVQMSESLGISPSITPAAAALGEQVDYTAAFTHPATGVTSGYGTSAGHWLSLALATGGKLTLNNPDDVDTILYGEGDSPGYIVCAASAVVRDADRAELMLYRHDWIPTWMDAAQLDQLIEQGMVVAAHANATRPADRYPAISTDRPTSRRVSWAG